jgi:RNA polymerase sigma-70 factor, ECF subfamily
MGERHEDQSWVEQSRRGDPEAFASLVRRYQRMIHALTYRMTGSLADAEDLAQETFIQAYRQLDGFRGEARFSSWLYRIAVNRCLNWRKRTRRQAELLADWRQNTDPTATTTDALARQIQEALMKLPAKQRAAVVLTTYDGLSHAEAAHALGCSETTVSWRLFAARRKLKRLLQPASPSHA